MTELVRRTTGEVDPAEAARLSKSKLMPEHIAGDAASVEYMMRFGAALGIDPMSSFQHIFVFKDGDGRLKAGMSAHLMQRSEERRVGKECRAGSAPCRSKNGRSNKTEV